MRYQVEHSKIHMRACNILYVTAYPEVQAGKLIFFIIILTDNKRDSNLGIFKGKPSFVTKFCKVHKLSTLRWL